MRLPLLQLCLWFVTIDHVASEASDSTKAACEEISANIPDAVSTLFAASYTRETLAYWSTTLRSIQPACIVHPKSTKDVSTAITILNKYPDVNFTAKSGGHDPNAGHATVSDGVLIALSEIAGVTYDDSTGLAHVKPGGEWNDVISSLEEFGVTIVGGRLGGWCL